MSLIERLGMSASVQTVTILGIMFLVIYFVVSYIHLIPVVRKIGAPLVLVFVGILLTNTGILPGPTYPLYNTINSIGMPLALSMLLFSIDLRQMKKILGAKPFLIMLLGAVATSVGGLIVGLAWGAIGNPSPDQLKGLAMMIGAGIGGTENFIAVGQSLQASTEALAGYSIPMVFACQSIVALNYIIAGNTNYQDRLNRWIQPTENIIDRIHTYGEDTTEKRPFNGNSSLLMFALACLATGVSFWLGSNIPAIPLPGGGILTIPSLLILTTIYLLFGTFTKFVRIDKMQEMGGAALYLVVLALFMTMDFSTFMDNLVILGPFFILCVIHWILIMLCAKLFKVDIVSTIIASTANMGGNVSAPICATLTGYKQLVPVQFEPHPVKRTVKKYKVFPVSSRALLAAFYAARQSACFSIGVRTPRLRWTRLVL